MTVQLDVVGICIQVVSCFLAALAFCLQKRAHIRISAGGIESWFAPANRSAMWIWRAGFALMVVCAVLDLISYPMLDLSKQAPMGALTLVFNSILAAIMLGEPFTMLDLMSTILIASGTITAVANSEAESTDFTFPDIISLLDDTVVFVYSGVLIPLLLASALYVELATRSSPDSWGAGKRRVISLLSPVCGGLFMGFTGYCAKSVSTVFAGGEWDQFKNPLLYLFIALAGVSVSGQLRYLNKGLAYFDALQVVPIFQCFIIFSNALAGIVYFHDMRQAAAFKLALFGVGGGVCMAGVAVLLLKQSTPHKAAAAAVDSELAAATGKPVAAVSAVRKSLSSKSASGGGGKGKGRAASLLAAAHTDEEEAGEAGGADAAEGDMSASGGGGTNFTSPQPSPSLRGGSASSFSLEGGARGSISLPPLHHHTHAATAHHAGFQADGGASGATAAAAAAAAGAALGHADGGGEGAASGSGSAAHRRAHSERPHSGSFLATDSLAAASASALLRSAADASPSAGMTPDASDEQRLAAAGAGEEEHSSVVGSGSLLAKQRGSSGHYGSTGGGTDAGAMSASLPSSSAPALHTSSGRGRGAGGRIAWYDVEVKDALAAAWRRVGGGGGGAAAAGGGARRGSYAAFGDEEETAQK